MKPFLFVVIALCALCGFAFAQQTIGVIDKGHSSLADALLFGPEDTSETTEEVADPQPTEEGQVVTEEKQEEAVSVKLIHESVLRTYEPVFTFSLEQAVLQSRGQPVSFKPYLGYFVLFAALLMFVDAGLLKKPKRRRHTVYF